MCHENRLTVLINRGLSIYSPNYVLIKKLLEIDEVGITTE